MDQKKKKLQDYKQQYHQINLNSYSTLKGPQLWRKQNSTLNNKQRYKREQRNR